DGLQKLPHAFGNDFVPAKIPLDVDAVGTLLFGLPDRLARLHAVFAKLVGLGDYAGSVVPQDADRTVVVFLSADSLGAHVEAIRIKMCDEILHGAQNSVYF